MLALVFSISLPSIAKADDNTRPIFTPDTIEKVNLLNSQATPFAITSGDNSSDLNSFPVDSEKLGFDTLYGTSLRWLEYSGEVTTLNDKWSSSKKFNLDSSGYKIDGTLRKWSQDNTSILPDDVSNNQESEGWQTLFWSDNSTKDIHALNLTLSSNPVDSLLNGISFMGFQLFSGLNWILGNILTLLISVTNLNVTSLLEALNWKALADVITSVVVGSSTAWSPFLIIAICASLFSILIMVTKTLTTGLQSIHGILQEIGIFVISMVLVFVALSGQYDTIINAMSDITDAALSSFIYNSDGTTKLFEYNTGDTTLDRTSNMVALTRKPFIDTVIESEFGVPVEELDLWDDNDPSVAQDNWGKNTQEIKNIVNELSDAGTNLFVVNTGLNNNADNNNSSTPNLGYYWYAISASRGNDTTFPYSKDGENGLKRNSLSSSNKVAFVVDFLASLDAQTPGGSVKAQQLMKQLRAPVASIWGMALVLLVTIATIAAILMACVSCLFGKVIFNVGIILVPLIPVFLLIRGTRQFGVSATKTWILSAVKMVVGQAIITMVLYMSAVISAGGMFGKMIDIILLIVIAIKAPAIISSINNAAASVINGSDQLPFASKFDRGYGEMARDIDRMSSKARATRSKAKARNEQARNALNRDKSDGLTNTSLKDPSLGVEDLNAKDPKFSNFGDSSLGVEDLNAKDPKFSNFGGGMDSNGAGMASASVAGSGNSNILNETKENLTDIEDLPFIQRIQAKVEQGIALTQSEQEKLNNELNFATDKISKGKEVLAALEPEANKKVDEDFIRDEIGKNTNSSYQSAIANLHTLEEGRKEKYRKKEQKYQEKLEKRGKFFRKHQGLRVAKNITGCVISHVPGARTAQSICLEHRKKKLEHLAENESSSRIVRAFEGVKLNSARAAVDVLGDLNSKATDGSGKILSNKEVSVQNRDDHNNAVSRYTHARNEVDNAEKTKDLLSKIKVRNSKIVEKQVADYMEQSDKMTHRAFKLGVAAKEASKEDDVEQTLWPSKNAQNNTPNDREPNKNK